MRSVCNSLERIHDLNVWESNSFRLPVECGNIASGVLQGLTENGQVESASSSRTLDDSVDFPRCSPISDGAGGNIFRGWQESPDSRQFTSGNIVLRDKKPSKLMPFRFSTLNNFCLVRTFPALEAAEISRLLLEKRFAKWAIFLCRCLEGKPLKWENQS